ncbi:alcohol dehydrogenase 4 [Trichomonascus vanleenenianus]|uniref:alcohol dehydrogenase ADH4 n=1 Tax=Trichomonascus vanleenenianus TaxID=2268995 RepID=UPI003ECA929A
MATSNVRFGPGVTREVGMDLKNLGVQKVALFTDKNLLNLTPVKRAIEGLEAEGIKYEIYSDVICEPKDYGVRDAIQWAREKNVDAYLAVGGGSVIDYAKIANLFQVYPEADLMDFVNAPVGKGLPITRKVKPLIAVPTTAGTGSETTGTAIFDLADVKSKTGIAHRALKPLLGIVDPENTRSMPPQVRAASGLDVLCHSLESWTAIPYNERTPRPTNPILRPAYQGANPISDIFAMAALEMTAKYLPRAVRDPEDYDAQENMLLAATLAGMGFGNAGVHLCHGLSYPISSQNKGYQHEDYDVGHPIIPHGVGVAVTSPSVFKFTAATNPERHLQAAKVFGADISNAKAESAGEILSDALKDFLYNKLPSQPKGISALGFGSSDLASLVKGALPQRRVLNLAPGVHEADEGLVGEMLHNILEDSLAY